MIQKWTANKKKGLHQQNSCAIIFNFTLNYQFTSRLTMEGKPLSIVDHTKLLGLIVSNDLTWSRNTQYLIKWANYRMYMLKRISSFSAPIKDLVQIYITYIPNILEQSCVIWHSPLKKKDSENLERVQKNALLVQNILDKVLKQPTLLEFTLKQLVTSLWSANISSAIFVHYLFKGILL